MENEVNEVVEQVEEKTHHHRHHSHHHHHHHHHHHKSSKKKKKFSLKRFVQKNKTPLRILAFALAIALTIGATVFVVKLLDQMGRNDAPVTNQSTTAPQLPVGQVAVVLNRFDQPVVLYHDEVSTYLSASISVPASDILGGKQADRLDQGQPLKLSFDVMGLADTCKITGFRVEVTEKGQKDPVLRKDIGADERSVMLYNLKTAATYQYVIRADFNAMSSVTVSGSFETAAGPRLLKVDGIANVRDFGSWKTADGKTVKQGLLYRGSELDGVVEESFLLKESGKNTLQNELGIRMEMDLRQTSERSSTDRLDKNVVYCPDPYNMPFFDAVFETGKADAVCRVFKDLANPENYPIYMHCTFGRDRTGTVCLILGAVLGMEEQTLLREYGLSALYYGDAEYVNANAVLAGLKTYEGDTLAQQAENYLLSIGLTEAEIASLRQIYLG